MLRSGKARILTPTMGVIQRIGHRSLTACQFDLPRPIGVKNCDNTLCLKIRTFHSNRILELSYPPHTLYPMPALSPTMETGSIAKWNISEGESFSAGDSLCEVQTDKASVDFEAQDDGFIAKILTSDGTDINVGIPICVVVDDEADVAAFKDFTLENPESGSVTTDTAEAQGDVAVSSGDTSATASNVTHDLGEFILTPAARHISQSKGLDATVLYPGTGKNGRITKGDVVTALKEGISMPPITAVSVTSTDTPTMSGSSIATSTDNTSKTDATATTASVTQPPTIRSPDPTNPFSDISNNNMRKVIAKRLSESKATVPHFYTTSSIPLDKILALRKKLAKLDIKFSVNDAIIRSSALALRDVPEMNASFNPKTQSSTISPEIDISVAVATPTGLITPIVTNANQRGLVDISNAVRDLATRARENKLVPEEYQGGSFTISNLGMFGINEFSAVINPPQAAILAVGGGVKTIVPTPYDESKGADQEKAQVQVLMEARLSADRRVVDEATAGLFMQALKY